MKGEQNVRDGDMSTPFIRKREKLIDAVIQVLGRDDRVIFAYLYGTMLSEGRGNDIDIAVFSDGHTDHYLYRTR